MGKPQSGSRFYVEFLMEDGKIHRLGYCQNVVTNRNTVQEEARGAGDMIPRDIVEHHLTTDFSMMFLYDPSVSLRNLNIVTKLEGEIMVPGKCRAIRVYDQITGSLDKFILKPRFSTETDEKNLGRISTRPLRGICLADYDANELASMKSKLVA